jgi:hypothetical protein
MHEAAVFAAEQILQKNTQSEWELLQAANSLLFEKFEPVNIKGLGADVQLVACAERIARINGHPDGPFAMVRSPL